MNDWECNKSYKKISNNKGGKYHHFFPAVLIAKHIRVISCMCSCCTCKVLGENLSTLTPLKNSTSAWYRNNLKKILKMYFKCINTKPLFKYKYLKLVLGTVLLICGTGKIFPKSDLLMLYETLSLWGLFFCTHMGPVKF